ncbi:hypothetical protein [Parasynechococcus marenigrum]|uniref:Uncharacterized protein n=1 Tax=Parasynechococcus marenigrum (strain WH8102) TaxID=84588 RepID=Q7U726_PARMW|nr:hypothetical protein [Parasynechococcus marenigrum]CAE07675.1 hypothetical [Parasynechococcus marenigrum WH 8102]
MPASEDELYLTCSACGSIHTISDAGDLELVEDKRPGASGINGIKTTTVGGDTWQQDKYIASEPQQYQPPITMIAGVAGKQNQIKADQSLLEASNKDWKSKNIPTDLK